MKSTIPQSARRDQGGFARGQRREFLRPRTRSAPIQHAASSPTEMSRITKTSIVPPLSAAASTRYRALAAALVTQGGPAHEGPLPPSSRCQPSGRNTKPGGQGPCRSVHDRRRGVRPFLAAGFGSVSSPMNDDDALSCDRPVARIRETPDVKPPCSVYAFGRHRIVKRR